jgi:dihydroorotate dehydrogenase
MLWLELSSAWRRRFAKQPKRPRWSERARVEAFGLRFPNRIGLAAGFDKGDVVPEALFALGFGFVEIGTVTPRPQAGNPKPRIFRLTEHHALVNRMGFNNPGADAVAARLAKVRHRAGPIWLNIGKNKDTPNEDAASDYVRALQTLYPFADAFVINISSPNTPGLRDLQAEDKLGPLLAATIQEARACAERFSVPARPVLLKLSPDLADDALPRIARLAEASGLSGLIATNTTLARPVEHANARESGGFSGPALRARASDVVKSLHTATALPIVGVGGVQTKADVEEKIAAGATLVEIYTGFIYGGPGTVKRLL